MIDESKQDTRTDSETVVVGTRRDMPETHEACLVIIRGARLGSRVVLGSRSVVIGRSIDTDFQISEKSISRSHCRVFEEDGRYWIEDLNSTNHTYLNDAVVKLAPLRDGDHIRISQTVLKFVDEDNIEAGYHSELHESTIRDPLTGLYNRRHAMAVLKTEIAKCKRDPGRMLAVMILDIDFFKDVNDEYGHIAGDGVLRQLVDAVTERVRASDTMARIGGEEFAVILPDTSEEEARGIAEAMRRAVEVSTFELAGKPQTITLSAGVAAWAPELEDLSGLLRAADERLYEAKSSGRNRVC